MDTSTPGRRTRIHISPQVCLAVHQARYTYEVSLAFVLVADVEVVFYEITYYIQTNYPKLMCTTVNYFEKTYLGSVIVDSEVRLLPAYPLGFWNHFARIIRDPEFPRTSNMVEGFHRGFKSRVHRPKPSVQEYVRAIKEQQVITDFHIDRLSVSRTPAKRPYCISIPNSMISVHSTPHTVARSIICFDLSLVRGGRLP